MLYRTCWQTSVWKDFDAKGCPAVCVIDWVASSLVSIARDACLCTRCISLQSHLQVAGKMWILEHRTEI